MPWDDGLEGQARVIAEIDASPLRVRAGPGTGKTWAVLRRVARLLEHGRSGGCHRGRDPEADLTARRRKDLRLGGGRVRALLHPKPLREKGEESYGVETRERLGVKLRVTGTERTLVDCLAVPRYAGGIEEVFQSAGGIPSLDLELLSGYLKRLGQRRLYAVVGFFLEREAKRLFVPGEFLDRLARKRPRARMYLEPAKRGGQLQAKWNLIVPNRWARGREAVEV